MGKFVKLVDEEGETIFVRPEDIEKVRDFGVGKHCVEVNEESIEVTRINDTVVTSLDDIMPVILEP